MSDFDRAERALARAERALARAFETHQGDHEFVPLDPSALTGSSSEPDAAGPVARRRRPWVGFAAAAVALVVVAPIAAGVFSLFNAQSSAPMLTGASAVAPAAAPEAASGRDVAGGAAAAGGASDRSYQADGRWESMLDASVQIPADWGYGFAPGPDWCVINGYERPERPFVERNPLSQLTADVQCTGQVDDDLRQTHLTWRHARPTDTDGVVEVSPAWVRVDRVVGSALLTIEVPAADVALAEQILATAQTAPVDPRGCSVDSPTGTSGGAIATLPAASEVTVCQYTGRDRPNLVGSYTLVGDQAQGVLDAVQEAPVASGPKHPTCGDVGGWLLLRFNQGEREVRLNLAECGQFVLDDGVTVRTPTRATCGDLLTGPLWRAGFTAETAACEPVR